MIRPICPHCDEPYIASGCFALCPDCDVGIDSTGNRCLLCNGSGDVDTFEPSCDCEPDELDFEEAS